jgi:hypothetical protein
LFGEIFKAAAAWFLHLPNSLNKKCRSFFQERHFLFCQIRHSHSPPKREILIMLIAMAAKLSGECTDTNHGLAQQQDL